MLTNRKQLHAIVYLIGLALMVLALPLSKFLMSISQFILIGNWLVEGSLKLKMARFFKNKAALVVVSLFLIHVIGLLFTTDFYYALKDLRTKLPLLVLPIVLSTTAILTTKGFYRLMLLYIGAVLAGTIISVYVSLTRQLDDIREISIYISHIRFSLNICLAIFTLGYFIYLRKIFSAPLKIVFFILIAWLIIYLFILESITGLSILLITSVFIFIGVIIRQKKPYLKIASFLIIIIIPLIAVLYVSNIIKENNYCEPIDYDTLDVLTSRGHFYNHDTLNFPIEDGKYTGIYLSRIELKESWNIISEIDFDSTDQRGQFIMYTLIRFLNSKGWRKDADAVERLNIEEIRLIENGVANINYLKKSKIRTRIKKLIWGINSYKCAGDPNGNTLTQRYEYWKASIELIKGNWFVGVGTGDMNKAFEEQYEKMNSKLLPRWRHRSHNQFLSITVAFGIFGFFWFLFTLIYPGIKTGKFNNYLYFVFFVIAMFSMLTEDTIESQAGVTFFAFFNCLLLFAYRPEQ